MIYSIEVTKGRKESNESNWRFNKRIKSLKEPYYRLAALRTTEKVDLNKNPEIMDCFYFDTTPEGSDFWWEILENKYPDIPEPSLRDLENEFINPNTKFEIHGQHFKWIPLGMRDLFFSICLFFNS